MSSDITLSKNNNNKKINTNKFIIYDMDRSQWYTKSKNIKPLGTNITNINKANQSNSWIDDNIKQNTNVYNNIKQNITS